MGPSGASSPPRPQSWEAKASPRQAEHSCDWLVVGAGPAGIAAVGKLIDNGVRPGSIAWVDPEFSVGDLGRKWRGVSSNTKVRLFRKFLNGCRSFGYDGERARFALDSLDPQGTCLLENVVEPLQWVTGNLMPKVKAIRSEIAKIESGGGRYVATSPWGAVRAQSVVLAIGAEPVGLGYPLPRIALEDALDAGRAKRAVDPQDVVGVFGSSHSAVMAVRNLIDAGASRVINFYRSPLRYAVDYGEWTLRDNTGLKGATAEWARTKMGSVPEGKLLRVDASAEQVERYLPQCSKVVYGVGFSPRSIPVEGVDLSRYDQRTGVVAQRLYGCGIAFPERVVDRAGNVELNVGIWKFMQYLDRVVPSWLSSSVGQSVRPAVKA